MPAHTAYAQTYDVTTSLGRLSTHKSETGSLLPKHPALIVPGLNSSDANHWQTLWHMQLANPHRIALQDWHLADLEKWRGAIKRSLAAIDQPAILIAHSFGALAAASVAAELPKKIAAVFLVAPADPDKFKIAHRLPQAPLQVPALVIASSNDPWMSDNKAAYWALNWGADYLRVKDLGHINSDSAIGAWPEGLLRLENLAKRVQKKH